MSAKQRSMTAKAVEDAKKGCGETSSRDFNKITHTFKNP